MTNILAFAGSNSSNSINKTLLTHVSGLIDDSVDHLDLSAYDVPVYGIDYEEDEGIPKGTKQLNDQLKNYDALIIAVNEHNGGPSVFFKNHIDWLSRLDRNFLKDKKLFIISTSPGRGGAKMSLEYAVSILPRFGAEVISHFSLASFGHSFSEEKGIYDTEQKQALDRSLKTFLDKI